jgi:hypothetical protein
MDGLKIQGELIFIGDTQQVKDTFTIRKFVVTNNMDKYPQEYEIQLTKDNCATLDNFKVGDTVQASVNLRGRGYTNKEGKRGWFTSLDCWRLEKVGSGTALPKQSEQEYVDNLPF